MQIANLLEKGIRTKTNLFFLIVCCKILLIPIILILAAKFDPRPFNILILPDLLEYEKFENIKNFFNINIFVANIGFVLLATLIKTVSNSELTKYIIYGILSLILMSVTQTILINYIFTQFPNASLKQKYLSLFFSLINFYILIYSIKPSSDVFGCFGIVILFIGIIKFNNNNNKYQGVSGWIIFLLIISLFRSNIFLIFPFLFLTKIFYKFNLELNTFNNKSRLVLASIIFILFSLNIFQFMGYLSYFLDLQVYGGLISQIPGRDLNSIQFKEIIKLIFFKFIYLLSARESIGINTDFLVTQTSKIFNYPSLINIITIFYLFLNNILGLLSIFRSFSKVFRNSFLFTLIPLIPLLSYFTHHRYFLPYCIFTSACIPFILEKRKYGTLINGKF